MHEPAYRNGIHPARSTSDKLKDHNMRFWIILLAGMILPVVVCAQQAPQLTAEDAAQSAYTFAMEATKREITANAMVLHLSKQIDDLKKQVEALNAKAAAANPAAPAPGSQPTPVQP